MTRFINSLIAAIVLVGFAHGSPPAAEAKTINLFNGKDLTGWHVDVPYLDEHPDSKATFIVRDGKLVSLGHPRGHLITDAKFEKP